jgi:hypothetical protein
VYRRLWALSAILLISASPMRAESPNSRLASPAAVAAPVRLRLLRPETWRDVKLERAAQTPQTTTAKPSKSRKTLMWVLIAAGGGAGAVLAMKAGGGSSSPETPQPSGSITLGQPTVGAP